MKLSIKTQDPHHHHGHQPPPPPLPQKTDQNNHPLLFRAKIPITIFNFPFISGFATTTHRPSDLALSLATNFLSGPTLKLSYSTATTATPAPPPLTLTLKSGIGQFGSPKDSPLVISANFSYNPTNSSPTFSLLFKPQLGSFCLKKSTFSNGDSSIASGFVPIERPLSLKDFAMDKNGKESILKGFSVTARTDMPVAKRVLMSFRWGVNFPEDISKQAPYLTANKIKIERIEEVKEVVKENKSEGNGVDSDILKGMCVWMKREVDVLQKENRELKEKLDDFRFGGFGRDSRKRIVPVVEDSGGFEQWRSRKNGVEEGSKKDVRKNNVVEESSKKDIRKNGNGSGSRVSDVESELERAIKAASSS